MFFVRHAKVFFLQFESQPVFFCLKVPSIKPMDRWRCFPYQTSWEVRHLGPCPRVGWEDARMIHVLNLFPYQASPGIITKTIAMVMLLEFWSRTLSSAQDPDFEMFQIQKPQDFRGIFPVRSVFFPVPPSLKTSQSLRVPYLGPISAVYP